MEGNKQKQSLKKTTLLGASFLVLSSFVFFGGEILSSDVKTSSISVPKTCDCYSTSPLNKIPVVFSNQVPGDLNNFNQSSADCFAWQEFIALNWPTNPEHGFGDTNDYSPVQWETFMPREVLFPPNGAAPPVWGTLVSDQYVKKFKSQKLIVNKSKTKLLTFTSKFSSSDTLSDFSTGQAAPAGPNNWLGAQNGKNVWYEIMLNKDYYDYIVSNQFYNAQNQHNSIKAGVPIDFPKGILNSDGSTAKTGAIEIKAAWMEIDSISSPLKWKRYKLSYATVMDPISGELRTTTVALVGLHILHKTQNQPTWVWATFEQIDNVPGVADNPANHPFGYNFYNASCAQNRVTYKSPYSKKDTAVLVSCTANTPPPYSLQDTAPVPIQVSRTNSIDQTDAAPINTKMQGYIQSFYPNSVWQYYQLVDVMWSQNTQPSLTPPLNTPFPLNVAAMTSGTNVLANTTLETYAQTTTCTGCHVFSQIAPLASDKSNNNKFGDFSFAIGFASSSPPKVSKKKIKKYSKQKK